MMKQAHNLPTYHKARLQMVGHRVIRAFVHELLDSYDINVSQWVMLGILYEAPTGRRVQELADLLVVEGPFVTAQLRSLRAVGYVVQQTDSRDKRAKVVTVTEDGQQVVQKIEKELTAHLRKLETGLSAEQLSDYFTVLAALIDNYGDRDMPA